jgi:uncharacterized protein YggL (DUF469 family)
MRKRVRKKRHLKEFKVLGVAFECEWTNPCTTMTPTEEEYNRYDKEYSAFWDKLVEWCESRNFTCGGGSNNKTIGWILETYRSKSQKCQTNPTDADILQLKEWLMKQSEIKSVKMSDKLDLWHDPVGEEINYTFQWSRI